VVCRIEDAFIRARMLERLIELVPPPSLPKLEPVIRLLPNPFECAGLLATLACRLPESHRAVLAAELLDDQSLYPQEGGSEHMAPYDFFVAGPWGTWVRALGKLAPKLSAGLKQRVFDKLEMQLRTKLSTGIAFYDSEPLASIAANLPLDSRTAIFRELLSSISRLKAAHDRVSALSKVECYIPKALQTEHLERSFMAASELEEHFIRGPALQPLVPPLSAWATDEPQAAHHAWCSYLRLSAKRPRQEMLRDLAILLPFVLALHRNDTPQAIAGAVLEVCGWWP
jgi:hypothetical protein